MAIEEHQHIVGQGVDAWNEWRKANPGIRPDLSQANLRGANLRSIDLRDADLGRAHLYECDLTFAQLQGAILRGANLGLAKLNGADLTDADLRQANLPRSELRNARLVEANLDQAVLSGADLSGSQIIAANLSRAALDNANLEDAHLGYTSLAAADLRGVNLTRANLIGAILIESNLWGASLSGAWVYGVSAWDLDLSNVKDQTNLRITRGDQPTVTVDNLEVAQFVYLLLNNEKIRDIIDTITSKAVLVLGRFTEERLAVLNAMREHLRGYGLTPILFDFDKPSNRDITGTVEILARMSNFVVADLTESQSIAAELHCIAPHLRQTPVLSVRLAGSESYSLFDDLRRSYAWVLETHEYVDTPALIASLPQLVRTAEEAVRRLRPE